MLSLTGMYVLSCSLTGNNHSDSITLDYLSQSQDLQGNSAPSGLLQCGLAPHFVLCHFEVVSSACVSTMLDCCDPERFQQQDEMQVCLIV